VSVSASVSVSVSVSVSMSVSVSASVYVSMSVSVCACLCVCVFACMCLCFFFPGVLELQRRKWRYKTIAEFTMNDSVKLGEFIIFCENGGVLLEGTRTENKYTYTKTHTQIRMDMRTHIKREREGRT